MTEGRLPYRPAIDGLRAIAIGLVVIFHFRLMPIGEAGFVGVDIFFVISGFLITRIIMDGLEHDTFTLSNFYLRRIRRLYPALLAVLAGYLAIGYFVFLPDLFEELSIEAALSQLYVVNIYFWRNVNYFGLQADRVPLLHMWSLSIEEQFYIFYPLFLVFLHRIARRWLLVVLVLCTFASFALGWFASGWKPQASFYLLPTRAWELLAGGVLAIILKRGRAPELVLQIAGPAGLGLIALTLLLHGPDTLFPGWFAALPVLGSLALLVSSEKGGAPISKILAIAPMVWLGKISYPLYLVHWPILIVLRDNLPETSYGWRLGGLVVSVALAWAITRYIETPIRRGRVLSGSRVFLSTAAGTTGVLLLFCGIVFQTSGLPERYDPQVIRLLSYQDDGPVSFAGCDWPAPTCPMGPEGEPEIALIGDSHAQALAGAFDIWLRNKHQPGTLMFGSACMPVLNTGDRRCMDFAESAIARAEASPSIHTVFLASIWRQPFGGTGLFVDGKFLSLPDVPPAFTKALENTVARLRRAGKTVILIDPLYAAPHNVPRTAARNLAFGTNWPLDTQLAAHEKEFARLYESFKPAEDAGALRISFIKNLCTDEVCPGLLNAEPVFMDGNHIRFGLSPVFAGYIDEAVSSLGIRP